MDIADRLLTAASSKAEAAEVLCQEIETRSVEFEHNRLKYVQTKATRGVGLRVICEGRLGFSATTDFRQPDRRNGLLHFTRFSPAARPH